MGVKLMVSVWLAPAAIVKDFGLMSNAGFELVIPVTVNAAFFAERMIVVSNFTSGCLERMNMLRGEKESFANLLAGRIYFCMLCCPLQLIVTMRVDVSQEEALCQVTSHGGTFCTSCNISA